MVFIPDPPGTETGTGFSSFEVETQRRLTKAFINTAPLNLVLTPRVTITSPSGGKKFAPGLPREVQKLRLVEPGVIPRPTVTVDGVVREVEFELLGEWNSMIAVGDTFSADGKAWEVVEVAFHNGWEQRALVSRVG